jgi:predicted DNA-binding transcriptional regulator YafY
MSAFPFNLGDIVAVNTHPFFKGVENIQIGGDTALLPPLMVIVEVVKENEAIRDQSTGYQVRSEYKCRCKWFSHKSYSFEEKWLNDEQLKLIQGANTPLVGTDLSYGDSITFTTHELESKKRKISTHFEDVYFGDNSTEHSLKNNVTINPLLNYLPPVMQVCCIKPNECKEPLYDKKKGGEIRKISKLVVKCLWFNSSLNKYSEDFLPIEALMIIDSLLLKERLNDIKNAIKGNEFLKISRDKKKTTIFKPKSFIYDGGYYQVRGYDYLLNRFDNFTLNDIINLEILDNPFKESAPVFNSTNLLLLTDKKAYKKIVTQSIIDLINKAQGTDNYVRIHYKNRLDKFSIRSIKATNLIHNANSNIVFVTAFCESKEEDRTFRIDRIQQAEILELKFQKLGTEDAETLAANVSVVASKVEIINLDTSVPLANGELKDEDKNEVPITNTPNLPAEQ